MYKSISFLTLFFVCQFLFAQSKSAYVLYNAKGKKVSYEKMMKDISKKDIVLFGEFHNNPISH